MLDNIQIGLYNNQKNCLTKINPISKIIMTLLFSIFTLIQNDFFTTILLLSLMIIITILSKTSVSIFYKIAKSIKYFIIFFLIINIINGFSIEKYIIDVLKLLLVMVNANILLKTTSLPDINSSLYQLLKPLCIFNNSLPSKISLMITLSIRFIPTLLEEANKILKTLKSKGLDTKSLSIKEKTKTITIFLKILIINTVKRADELADNMELRNYKIDNYQLALNQKQLKFIDYLLISSYLLIFVCIIMRGIIL